jgi:hypothetical protein
MVQISMKAATGRVNKRNRPPVHFKNLFPLIVWIHEVSCTHFGDCRLLITALLFHICSMCLR